MLSLQDGRSGIAMEEFVEKSYLFDFYGELLTEHQRRIYSEINFEDYTAAEVARDEGISRQGVHDAIKAAEAQLVKYENMLGLVRRYREMEKAVAACREELGNIRPQPGSEAALDRARASLELIERIER